MINYTTYDCKTTFECICATHGPANCHMQSKGKLIKRSELNTELPDVIVTEISIEERWGKYL